VPPEPTENKISVALVFPDGFDPATAANFPRKELRPEKEPLEAAVLAKPVGVGAVSQRLIPTGERSGLQTRIAATVNASLCAPMKS